MGTRRKILEAFQQRGGARRDRTADLLHAMQALSQLSYGPTMWKPRMIAVGLNQRQALIASNLTHRPAGGIGTGFRLRRGASETDRPKPWPMKSFAPLHGRRGVMNLLKSTVAIAAMMACNVHAGTLFKCVSSNGAVSWQSAPCAHGTRIARSVAFTPAPSESAQAPQATMGLASSVRRSSAAGASSRKDSGHRSVTRIPARKADACAQARLHRDTTLERVGLNRKFDLLSRLDAAVRHACR